MLPKKYRLKRKKDFNSVFKSRKSQSEKFLILKIAKNNLKFPRVGFVVSQKVSKKATVRNKIKRRLREVVRTNLEKIKPGYDLVFLGQKGSEEKNSSEIKQLVEKLLKKAKILKGN